MKQSGRKIVMVGLFFLAFLSITAQALAAESDAQTAKQWEEASVIWAPGEVEGVHMFHQFGTITTADGVILVFAEGRVDKDDSGKPHHICMKRSLDGGNTWGETIIVANAETDQCSADENETNGRTGHCYANPTAMVDRNTGRIHLMYAENYDNEYTRLYITHSDDDGLTWSSPTELTGLFNDDPYARPFHLPGPGHGIQLRGGGRLIVEVWHRLSIKLENDMRQYGLSILYSDDGGETWENSGYLDTDHLNEGRIAEMPDGRLMINARSIDRQRYKVISVDGGQTWGISLPFTSIGTYGDCDGGFYSDLRDGYTRLLTTHVENDTTRRNNLSIYLSYDEGRTWGYEIELWRDPEVEWGTGASDITMIADGVYGVIHGTSWDGDQEVRFLRVRLSDITGTEDETQVKHTHLGGEAAYFHRARCAICASPYGERRRISPFILLPLGAVTVLMAATIYRMRREAIYRRRGRRKRTKRN